MRCDHRCVYCENKTRELRELRRFVVRINKITGSAEDLDVLSDIADKAGMLMEKYCIVGEIWRQGSEEPVGRVR